MLLLRESNKSLCVVSHQRDTFGTTWHVEWFRKEQKRMEMKLRARSYPMSQENLVLCFLKVHGQIEASLLSTMSIKRVLRKLMSLSIVKLKIVQQVSYLQVTRMNNMQMCAVTIQ